MTNIAATTWAPQQGDGEYSLITAVAIVDGSGTSLVDGSGTSIVSSDSMFTTIPATTWTKSDGS